MKNQALFSLKDKSKKLKCRLLQFLFAALGVNLKVVEQFNTAKCATFNFCLPQKREEVA